MKKILLIDNSIDGHHEPYLNAINSLCPKDFIILLPQCNYKTSSKTILIKKYNLSKYFEYLKWLKEINKIIDNEKPDIVHFLYGDVLYRFFGIGLNPIRKKCKKLIITFHQFRIKSLVKISLKRIFKKITIGIVHTNYNEKELKLIGIRNIKVIDYPQLYNFEITKKQDELKIKYNSNKNEIIFSLIGGIMKYKGIEVLFDAIPKMKNRNFKVILAGKLYDYSIEQIELMMNNIKDNIIFKPFFLSNEEFLDLIGIADYIILPYRNIFDGASGPLTEAVWARKPIISSNNKALGEITKKNKLGYIFESENSDDLAKIMDYAIENKFKWNNTAEEFRNKINLQTFLSKIDDIY